MSMAIKRFAEVLLYFALVIAWCLFIALSPLIGTVAYIVQGE